MEFFALIAGIAGLVWGAWFLLRGSLVAGSLAMLVAGSVCGYAFWHADIGPVPVTIDRLAVSLLVVAYLVHRKLGLADPKPLGRAEWVLIAFLSVLVLSTFTHDWRYFHSQPVFKLVQYALIPGAVYWVIRQSSLDEPRLRQCFGVLAAFGLYTTLIALAEMSGQWWAVFPRHLALPNTEFFGRARGPLLNPAANGILISLGLACGLTFWPRWGRFGKLLLIAFTGLSAVALYGTLTRSAWIGGALALAVIVGLNAPRPWRIVLFGGGLLALMVFTATRWDSIWNLKRDVNLDASAAAESVELRPILAKVAWEMFLDRPLAGAGYGQYDRAKLPYLADRSSELPLEKSRPYVQHNAFLALLTETGLIGAGCFVLLVALWTIMAWRLWRSGAPLESRQVGLVFLALMAAYLPNANFHDTNTMEMVNVLVFFIAGLVSGVTHDSRLAAHSEA